ncbi:MAG: hypothetical protein ACREOU_03020 [Candidatus Eiseniibacteriota bacterium]
MNPADRKIPAYGTHVVDDPPGFGAVALVLELFDDRIGTLNREQPT